MVVLICQDFLFIFVGSHKDQVFVHHYQLTLTNLGHVYQQTCKESNWTYWEKKVEWIILSLYCSVSKKAQIERL